MPNHLDIADVEMDIHDGVFGATLLEKTTGKFAEQLNKYYKITTLVITNFLSHLGKKF